MEMLLSAGIATEAEATLSTYCRSVFLPAKEKELKPSTFETYERRIFNHLEPGLGGFELTEITPQVIRKWLSDKPSKIQRECRRMLRIVLQSAIYDGFLDSNPVDRVRPPKVERYEPEVLDAEDVEVYLWHFRDMRSEPFVLIAMGCGLRRGELVALNVEDINPVTGSIVVDNSIVPTKAGAIDGAPKSQSGYRTVHMPKIFLDRLLEIMPESGAICRTLDGYRMAPAAVTHLYIKERDLLPDGVPRVSLKNLRHTSLTLAFDSGADIMAVKERAGHSNISITSRFYVRPKGERDIEAAALIDKKLAEKAKNRAVVTRSYALERSREKKKARAKALTWCFKWCPQRELNPCLSLESSAVEFPPVSAPSVWPDYRLVRSCPACPNGARLLHVVTLHSFSDKLLDKSCLVWLAFKKSNKIIFLANAKANALCLDVSFRPLYRCPFPCFASFRGHWFSSLSACRPTRAPSGGGFGLNVLSNHEVEYGLEALAVVLEDFELTVMFPRCFARCVPLASSPDSIIGVVVADKALKVVHLLLARPGHFFVPFFRRVPYVCIVHNIYINM